MRRLLTLLVLVLAALSLASCGGGGETVTVTVNEEAEADAATKSTEEINEELEAETVDEAEPEDEEEASGDASQECDEKEITAGARKEGTCEIEGTKVVVVNRKSTLKMETLEAKLLGINEQKTISGFDSATANGIFVSFEIELTNLSTTPATFEESQCILYIDGNIYTQDFEVQNGIEEKSFMWSVEDIQPQSTEIGTVTFDVPTKVSKQIGKDGNLDFLNFGAEWYEVDEFFDAEEVGTIRTYK